MTTSICTFMDKYLPIYKYGQEEGGSEIQMQPSIIERKRWRNCGCSSNLCCSKWGYCGTGDDYYGTGCKEGPCTTTPTPSTPSTGGAVSSIISKDFFDAILNAVDSSCAGKSFYTYDGFIQAANAYSGFGTTGSSDDAKRELAAFFAHVTHETGSFCYIEEIDGASKKLL
ncbi:hypothetical protein SUGI_0430490 [Cryptomeria japonica]|nr:hypothetical protein SUGI_0430490 [Cryptomeria japonica]